jgi:hypothetical protein
MTLLTLVMHSDESQSVRRSVQLPREQREAGPELLHVCESCSGELVYPLDWIEENSNLWWMILRCPDCEVTRDGLFVQREVDLFADELDRGEAELLHALKRVTRENMTEAADFFIRALHADLIVPSDFQR